MRQPWLARLGQVLVRRRRALVVLQWLIVGVYALLVIVPAFLPPPAADSRLLGNLTLLAQFAFWGLWWPGVILATMLFGRIWCGLLCPEGTLTEFASRHGRQRALPHWLRQPFWPVVAFLLTTLYGQLVSVYEYPRPALLILGGSTVAAIGVGLLYGRGKRGWCRYLCPVSGVFALLARIAPLHYAVDRAAWESWPQRIRPVDCPVLLDVRHLHSAAQCHACGRCAGHRQAVQLAARAPGAEILAALPQRGDTAQALLLLYGLLGLALGAFLWTLSPWYIALHQQAATWLVEHGWFGLLETGAPWWLLTHYPASNDAFSWLDGAMIVLWLGAAALLLGTLTAAPICAAARLARLDWRTLAFALIPLAGAGLLLGLTMLTLAQLRAEGLVFGWLDTARAIVLAGAIGWSGWLGLRLISARRPGRGRAAAAMPLFLLALVPAAGAWYLGLFAW